MKRIITAIFILILFASPLHAFEINGDVYTRYYFSSSWGEEEANGYLGGVHLETPSLLNRKLIPFMDWQVTSKGINSNTSHFIIDRGNFGGGLKSEWDKFTFTFKASSLHAFDRYEPVWSYNYVEARYSW